MHLFEVIALDVTDVPPLAVFAGSYDMAVHDHMIWLLNHRDGDMPDVEVRRRNASWPGLNVAMLAKRSSSTSRASASLIPNSAGVSITQEMTSRANGGDLVSWC